MRVLVVGEDPLARSGLASILAQAAAVEIAGLAGFQDDVALSARANRAEVILWDLGIGPTSFDRLRELEPFDVPVLVLLGDPSSAADALAAGARAILLRDADGEHLASALDAARLGLAVLDTSIARELLHPAPRLGSRELLTPRELEVLELLSRGLSNKLIADRLAISEHTAKFHVNAILAKLGAESRTEAVVLAARLGLVVL